MAVSANSGSFIVYALKSVGKQREDVESPEGRIEENFTPVTDVGAKATRERGPLRQTILLC